MARIIMGFKTAQRVLYCLRYGIGDIIMEMPVIKTLRNTIPDAHITGFGALPALELLQYDPRIDRLVNIHTWGLRHWGDTGSETIRGRLRQWIIKQRFDLILDPSHAVIAARNAMRDIDDDAITILDTGDPTPALRSRKGGVAAIKESTFRGWGLEIPENIEPELHLRENTFEFAKHFLRKNGISNTHQIAGISPVATSRLKQWPLDRLAAVADELIQEWGMKIMQFCGPQTADARELLKYMRNPEHVLTVGPFHLGQVAALQAHCNLFICNDTGLMHMAAAMDVPVIAIFGPTSPLIYLPGNGAVAVFDNKNDCQHRKTFTFGPSPCIVKNRCMAFTQECIQGVTIEQVMSAVEDRLRTNISA